jgi:predicted DsbA family dithiol-disulfide isomerase
MSEPRAITMIHFSDVLCIWAYGAQIRLDEVRAHFGARVIPEYRFVSVFGSTAQKIGAGWAERGGFSGYARHMESVAARFPHVTVSPDAWERVRPASSTSPHLFLKAVQLLSADSPAAALERFEAAAWALRVAFFRDARDIARREVQLEVAEALALPVGQLEASLADGRAFAALSEDADAQQRLRVEGSPTFLLNEGRQRLYGNVGYRAIAANIEELLHAPEPAMASWC